MEFFEIGEWCGPIIKVIGVGGGGINALNDMIRGGLAGVQFIAVDTDKASLADSLAEDKILIGDDALRTGRNAALDDIDRINTAIGEADMVFIVAGMGGAAGTKLAPSIAQAAKEHDAVTVGVVSMPFEFEGREHLVAAEKGIDGLLPHVHSLITVPGDKLPLSVSGKSTPADMLKEASAALHMAVRAISDLIINQRLIAVDFTNVCTVLGESSIAVMGIGRATGQTRARDAAIQAITSPLLDGVSTAHAAGVLINITSSPDISIEEIGEVANIIQEEAHEDTMVFFGYVCDDSLGNELRVTVIIAGIDVTAIRASVDTVDKFDAPAFPTGKAPSAFKEFIKRTSKLES